MRRHGVEAKRRDGSLALPQPSFGLHMYLPQYIHLPMLDHVLWSVRCELTQLSQCHLILKVGMLLRHHHGLEGSVHGSAASPGKTRKSPSGGTEV